MTCLAFFLLLPKCSRSALMCFLLAITACALASADLPKAKPAPCALTDAVAAGLNGDASADIHAVSDYKKTIAGLLDTGKFEQLDCLADAARSSKETFSGGMWKLHAIYSGLEKPALHATQEDWDTHMELVQRWVTARPDSITAQIALAESCLQNGWDARGKGETNTVSKSGWKLFADRAAKARQILEQSSAVSAKDPEWYLAMQGVALAQEWDAAPRRALLEQAVKFGPAYYYYYRAYANSILIKWFGKKGDVEYFLEQTADNIGGDAGDALYFRVAGLLVCSCPDEQKLRLSWPRILKGFVAVETQTGTSPENWNRLARMAVTFDHPVMADKMFDKIGDQWSEDVWQTPAYYESIKQWARKAAKARLGQPDRE